VSSEAGAALRVAGAVRVRVPLRRPMVTAHGAWPVCDSWLMRVVDDEGRTGWGEATLGPFAAAAAQAALDDQVRAVAGSPLGRALAAMDLVTATGSAVRAALDGAGQGDAHRPPRAAIAVNALGRGIAARASVTAAREAVTALGTSSSRAAGRSTHELVERLAAVQGLWS
jgi:L-alanine-DL-glutamate epimerase-like enolase superfamily enzyme